MSFKVTPFNDRVLYIYVHSENTNKKQLNSGVSSKDYKVIWKIKRENKVLIEEFSCTMDKTERHVENEV